jgi:hypothetical protein
MQRVCGLSRDGAIMPSSIALMTSFYKLVCYMYIPFLAIHNSFTHYQKFGLKQRQNIFVPDPRRWPFEILRIFPAPQQ